MKRCALSTLSKAALGIMFLVTSIFSQEAKCDLAKLRLTELRGKLLEKFKLNDYDQAYKIATEMVEVGETNCAANEDILLMLNMNVAQIQINRKKLDEAQRIYDQKLELAERVYGANSADFQKYTEDLLKLSVRTVGIEKYESYALKLLDAKKKRFGDNSVEFLNEMTRMARLYAAWKKYDIAEGYFSQAMDVADKLPLELASAKGKAINRYRVFLITRYGETEGLAKGEALMLQRYPDFPGQEGVLNGSSYSLPRPAFASAARNIRASGEVLVSITIDENGRVTAATATSGHPLLRGSAEIAARSAKFLPTYLKGKPVKVSGVITYRFND